MSCSCQSVCSVLWKVFVKLCLSCLWSTALLLVAAFRQSLLQEAQKAFPEAAASYQSLKDTVAEDQGQAATAPDTSTPAA